MIIKTERANLGLSRKAFAEKLGVTSQYIYCVEHEECQPSYKVLIKLAELTGKQLKVTLE